MLVPSMNPQEITKEVLTDFNKLYDTTATRLGGEYNRERKKLKIDKTKAYIKTYTVKTHSKNPWILYLRKAPAIDKYQDEDSIHVGFVTYYYGGKGLTVFNMSPASQLQVFYGHFFKRYNERMNLNLSTPIDVVKNYFFRNGYAGYSVIPKEGKEYVMGFSPEGILLGELQHNRLWLVNKTFVSRDLSRHDQDEAEKALILKLRKEIDVALRNPMPVDPISNSNMSVVKALEEGYVD